MKRKRSVLAIATLCVFTMTTACVPGTTAPSNNAQYNSTALRQTHQKPDLVRVTKTNYRPETKVVTLYTQPAQGSAGENIIDLRSSEGVVNFTSAHYPVQDINTIRVYKPSGQSSLVHVMLRQTLPQHPSAALSASAAGSILVPPPGVSMDNNLTPVAGLNASRSDKANAVLQIAKSKLGTPYIWGHNEDRGQTGFDCSNFTAYVYHHALGYSMTGNSLKQASSVGVNVPTSDMQVGDLLIFEDGKHVGIFSGNGKMIEEGGGLGKVGYLGVGQGSYWGNRLTAVKRMF